MYFAALLRVEELSLYILANSYFSSILSESERAFLSFDSKLLALCAERPNDNAIRSTKENSNFILLKSVVKIRTSVFYYELFNKEVVFLSD